MPRVVDCLLLEGFKKTLDSYWSGMRPTPTTRGVLDLPSLEGYKTRLDSNWWGMM